MIDINSLKYNETGLIPAIVQDAFTNEVLMMAWMNAESLKITIEEGTTCFFSRSRQSLWRKGETSGNTQRVQAIYADCDSDTLLVKVIQKGKACHNGTLSCFSKKLLDFAKEEFSLEKLYDLIEDRNINKKEGSYTSYLFDKGLDKILKKIGEESSEVIIAAKNDDNDELVCEISDLVYHALVLMVEKDIHLSEVREELAKRHVVDEKVKQESSGGSS